MGLVRAVAGALIALVVAGCATSTAEGVPTPSAYGIDAAGARRVTPLPAASVVDYQLGGAYPPAASVRVVDRDRADAPVRGRYNVCYVNAFQTQPGEAGFWRSRHPTLLLRVRGRLVQDPSWPGEYLLDTSTAAKRAALAGIVGGWVDGCARAGFQAVEADNLDSWTRRGVGGALTETDNLAFAALLIRRAHADGLAIAQKNAAEYTQRARRTGFDFAVAEECEVFGECGAYTTAYGARVIEIEYTDNGRAAYDRACAARRGRISILLRDRDVVPRGSAGYVYRHC